jgi:hypothetical protein
MTTKSMNKLSTMLSEVLSSTLEQGDVASVMEAWNERKSEVSKLLGSGTRVKRKKDSNAPKKWKTGYILFCVDQREKLKKENEGLSATEITSRLGAMWKKISDKDKAKYEALSSKDKVRYEKEMESYTPPPEDEVEEKTKRGREKKERTGPKRALSSYMYFCQDARESVKNDNPDMNGKEVTSELGRRWKELTDEQKLPFEAKASADKTRYQAEKGVEAPDAKSSKKASAKEPAAKVSKKAPAEKVVKATDAKAADAKASKKAPAEKAAAKPSAKPAAKSSAKTQPVEATEAKVVAKPSKGKVTPKREESKREVTPKREEAAEKVVAVKKTPGFEVFCDESRDDIQTENPEWGSRKVMAEVQKKWQELTADDREAYEADAAEASDVEELEEN